MRKTFNTPQEALRYHVTEAIKRGEEPIAESRGTHCQWTKAHKPTRPCTVHDLTFGGKCLNCGYKGDSI